MKIYQLNWLTKPSSLWYLKEDQFCRLVLQPMMDIAKTCCLKIGGVDLDEEVMKITLCGPKRMIPLYMKLTKSRLQLNLQNLHPSYPSNAFSELHEIIDLWPGELIPSRSHILIFVQIKDSNTQPVSIQQATSPEPTRANSPP